MTTYYEKKDLRKILDDWERRLEDLKSLLPQTSVICAAGKLAPESRGEEMYLYLNKMFKMAKSNFLYRGLISYKSLSTEEIKLLFTRMEKDAIELIRNDWFISVNSQGSFGTDKVEEPHLNALSICQAKQSMDLANKMLSHLSLRLGEIEKRLERIFQVDDPVCIKFFTHFSKSLHTLSKHVCDHSAVINCCFSHMDLPWPLFRPYVIHLSDFYTQEKNLSKDMDDFMRISAGLDDSEANVVRMDNYAFSPESLEKGVSYER